MSKAIQEEEKPKIEQKPKLSLQENSRKRFDSPENEELWEKARDILPMVQVDDPKSFRTMAAMMTGVMNFNSKYIEEKIEVYKAAERKEEKLFDLPEEAIRNLHEAKAKLEKSLSSTHSDPHPPEAVSGYNMPILKKPVRRESAIIGG